MITKLKYTFIFDDLYTLAVNIIIIIIKAGDTWSLKS